MWCNIFKSVNKCMYIFSLTSLPSFTILICIQHAEWQRHWGNLLYKGKYYNEMEYMCMYIKVSLIFRLSTRITLITVNLVTFLWICTINNTTATSVEFVFTCWVWRANTVTTNYSNVCCIGIDISPFWLPTDYTWLCNRSAISSPISRLTLQQEDLLQLRRVQNFP